MTGANSLGDASSLSDPLSTSDALELALDDDEEFNRSRRTSRARRDARNAANASLSMPTHEVAATAGEARTDAHLDATRRPSGARE